MDRVSSRSRRGQAPWAGGAWRRGVAWVLPVSAAAAGHARGRWGGGGGGGGGAWVRPVGAAAAGHARGRRGGSRPRRSAAAWAVAARGWVWAQARAPVRGRWLLPAAWDRGPRPRWRRGSAA